MGSGIRGAARRRVDRSAPLVRTGTVDGVEGGLPQLHIPAGPAVELSPWAQEHQAEIAERLLRHGALLFRGFGLRGPLDFEAAAAALAPAELHGDYGDLPRQPDSGKLFFSTPYPDDLAIHFHNESSHLSSWPRVIFFFCATAPADRGETPLLDCRLLCRVLDAGLVEEFVTRGLTYTRNFSEGIDVRWQDFFGTDDRAEVDRRGAAAGIDVEWLDGDRLRIRQHAAAVRTHPLTGDRVFFNQVLLHHPAALPTETRSALLEVCPDEDSLPRSVSFGDGGPIPDATIGALLEAYDRYSVRFPWEAGDVLMLDNMLVSHGRAPFRGPRRILVAMSDIRSAGPEGPR